MAKESLVKQLLTKAGLVSRAEIARGHDFVHGAVRGNKGRVPPEELYRLLKMLSNFLQLDERNVCNIPSETIYGLGFVLAQTAVSDSRLDFVSFASPAYIQNSRGEHIDITSGVNKKEYAELRKVARKLDSLFTFPFSYSIYLVDLDPEVKGKSKEEINRLFVQNLAGLRRISGRNEAKRLSSLVPHHSLHDLRIQFANNVSLTREIEELKSRKTVQKAHKIGSEAIEERALTYAAIGRYLEENAPNLILLDIQGKIYPYEQPFYNTLRSVPLPLIRVIKP